MRMRYKEISIEYAKTATQAVIKAVDFAKKTADEKYNADYYNLISASVCVAYDPTVNGFVGVSTDVYERIIDDK